MANNLRKFNTLADYQSAELVKPAVSLIASDDSVHFDQKDAPTVNDKIMMYWYADVDGSDIVLYNGASSDCNDNITAVIVNDDEVTPKAPVLVNASEADTDYLVQYSYSADTICDAFAGNLGGGWEEEGTIEFLIPAQITEIESLPLNIDTLVVEATTPPTASFDTSGIVGGGSLVGVYVPDDSVNDYKTEWASLSEYIQPISDYNGALPV